MSMMHGNVLPTEVGKLWRRIYPNLKPCSTKGKSTKRKPQWICTEALVKVKKKYHAWKRYTTTKQYQDYEAYIKLRNEATKGVKSAKRQFERRLAQEIKETPIRILELCQVQDEGEEWHQQSYQRRWK